MRFVKGDSLKEAIAQFHGDAATEGDSGRRSLELRKLLRRFTDVCNAIDYAHSRGVLHRDIKPGNIIVGKHGETHVVDWGLAKPLGRVEPPSDAGERALMPSSASSGAETQPGSVLGTPAYMLPEQAAGAMDQLGPRSDVYSLGATLYAILTGRAPIEGKDQADVLDRTRRGDFPAPRALSRDVDPALDAICRKAMSAHPDDRYDSARTLAEDLERWMADEAITAHPDRPLAAALRWFRHRPVARAWALAAVIADVLLLLTWSGLFPLTSFLDHLSSFPPHPADVYDPVPLEIYNLNVRLKGAFRLTNYAVAAQLGGIVGGLIGLAMQLGRPRVTPAVVACSAALGTVAGAMFLPRLGLALIRWLSNL
jgi:serine/threonine protein kinase